MSDFKINIINIKCKVEHAWRVIWSDYCSWGEECSRCGAFRGGDFK